MAITVGRVGWTVAPLNPTNISRSPGRLSMSGTFVTMSTTFARLAAAQIPALLNPDEPVVPVLFGENADLNGFYRVVGADVDLAPDAIDNGHVGWSIDLEPVPDCAGPVTEHILDTVLRTNSVSITAATSQPWHAIPQSAGIYSYPGVNPDDLLYGNLDTATGPIWWGDDPGTPPFRRVAQSVILPGDWYRGAATIEWKWGSDWLPFAGRSLPSADPLGVLGISNGLVRVRMDPTDRDVLLFSCWDGAWESETEVKLLHYINPPPGGGDVHSNWLSAAILRNSPEEVRLRLTAGSFTNMGLRSVLDLRLRRGFPTIDMRWQIPNGTSSFSLPQELVVTPSPSWTAISGGGGRRGAADGSGNRVLQFYPIASVNSSLTSWTTSFGFQTPAWAALAPSVSEVDLRNGYFAATAETVRIVGS